MKTAEDARKLAYNYDIAREELNLLCDWAEESDRIGGTEIDRMKSKVRASLDECFEIARKSEARDAAIRAEYAGLVEAVKDLIDTAEAYKNMVTSETTRDAVIDQAKAALDALEGNQC